MSASSHRLSYGAIEGGIPQDDLSSAVIYVPEPSTHDVSLVSEHAPDINCVTRRLQAAVDETWKTRDRKGYSEVHVPLLRWEDDDLKVAVELEELGVIFSKCYNFSVESWKIPTEKPATKLQRRLADFVDNFDETNTLLIVYYAGHAMQNEQRDESPIWVSRRYNPARLPSSTLQSVLAECDSDVLLLYDCCHAVPSNTGATGEGITEFLVACGFEGIAAEVGEDSFTNCLIQELGGASYGSIAIVDLYERMIDSLKESKPPCIARDEFGRMRLNPGGKPLFERTWKRTPIHRILTNSARRRSIILSPLGLESTNQSACIPFHRGTESSADTLDYLRRKRRRGTDRPILDQPERYPEVLLSIKVETADFDIKSWSDWLCDVPPEATGIKVDGVYRSLSTVIILRMPINAWSLMPNNPAYSFVGFVTSENLVPEFTHHDLIKSFPDGEDNRMVTEREHNRMVTEREHIQEEPKGKSEPKSQGTDRQEPKSAESTIPPPKSVPTSIPSRLTKPVRATNPHHHWTCCECHESGMTLRIDGCPHCSHFRCEVCDWYSSTYKS